MGQQRKAQTPKHSVNGPLFGIFRQSTGTTGLESRQLSKNKVMVKLNHRIRHNAGKLLLDALPPK